MIRTSEGGDTIGDKETHSETDPIKTINLNKFYYFRENFCMVDIGFTKTPCSSIEMYIFVQ